MKRYGAGLPVLLAVLIFLPSLIQAKYLQDGLTYANNRIVIAIKPQFAPVSPGLKSGVIECGLPQIDALNHKYSVTIMWPLFPKAEKHGEPAMAGYYSLTFGTGTSLELVLEAYAALSVVEHVEPVGVHRIYFVPNDPSLGTQWALNNIQARQAWDIGRGDSTVPLGIADTGVDWDHPDLAGNVWYNFADPIDGMDNDGNGYVDDIRGWDWVVAENGYPGEDDNTADNNPMDFDGHGTHVSGIASAVTNNAIGVAGVGYNCSIMCLRIGWKGTDGNGYVGMDYAASAFTYAADKGAKAINCSWGSNYSLSLYLAANYAVNHGVVIVSAAGNDNISSPIPYLCQRTDVIAVAATDESDIKASFSNYGSWVDVSAPGVNNYSTYFNNIYTTMSGTSMAAPHVTGLVGLIRAAAPTLTRAQVVTRITSTADNIDALNPGYANQLGSGRINAASAMAGLGTPLTVPIAISPISNLWISTPHPTFIWSDTSQASIFHLQVDQHSAFNSMNVNDSSITDTTFLCPDSLIDGAWYWRISAGNGDFWTSYSALQLFRIDTRQPNTTTLLTPAMYSWTRNRRPYFSWNAVTDVGGSGISKYFIQIDSDSLFAAPRLVEDSTPNTTNYTPMVDLPSDGIVYWRVRARDVAGNYALYATSHFTIDNTPPASPINFAVNPHIWTANPAFSLNWINPSEPAGIYRTRYKVGIAPVSDNDTSGHFSGTPPVSYTATATGPTLIFIWLEDAAGNNSYLNRAQDTVKYDNTPPSGSTASSPTESGNLTFTVSWSIGTDIGSGLAGIYDVRGKDGAGGAWNDWRIGISGLSSTFTGVHGHTYYFEARARDLAGNLEPFTGIAETQTLVDTTLAPSFVPGDANGSGSVNGVDIVYLINYLKGFGPPPPDPILRGDANGSCSVYGVDVTYLLSYLKGGGPPPFAGNCKR